MSGRPILVRSLAGAGLVVAASLASCGGAAGPQPTVSILAPTNGMTISAGSAFTLELQVTNWTWATPGTPDMPNTGHYHLYLDNNFASYIYVGFADVTTPMMPAGTPSGSHTLTVSLRNSDHSPLNPPVQAAVTVTVP